jgi:phosphoadenosine phosphosulfate reductase
MTRPRPRRGLAPRQPTAADLAARLDAELRDAHPLTILRKAYETFGDKLALVSSFGAESAVLLHLASQVSKDIPCCSSTPACCLARPWTTASRWPPVWA